MKTTLRSHALPLILLGVLSGCGKSESTAPAGPTVTANETEVSTAQLAPGDFVPARLVALPADLANLPTERLAFTAPASPKATVAFAVLPKTEVSKAALVPILPGSTEKTVALAVDEPEGATISLIPRDSAAYKNVLRDLQIYEPTGRLRIDLRDPKLDALTTTDMQPLSTVDLKEKSTPGAYLLKVGTLAAKTGATVWINLPQSKISLELTPSTTTLLAGEKATVKIRLTDDGAPIQEAALEGSLIGAGLAETPLTFTDVGGGNYEALVSDAFVAGSKPGVYDVKIRARGTSNGRKFDRYAKTAMSYVVPTGRILSVSAPREVKDGTGLVDAYELDVKVESAADDRFEVDGMLAVQMPDGTDRPLATAQTAETFGAGVHTITLRFEAGYLALSKLEGPVVLRGLTLFSQGWRVPLQRHLRGLEIQLPAIEVAKIKPLAVVPPSVDELINTGAFDLTK